MGQTYNITMKQFNGVDYDVLLPASVGIEKIVYTGNGTYGESSPTSITFSSAPQLILLPNYGYPSNGGSLWGLRVNQSFTPTELFSKNYVQIASYVASAEGVLYAKKSDDGKTFSWYATNGANQQSNTSGMEYYCYGIGGFFGKESSADFSKIITESGTFVVPQTGRYYLELHGGGGGAAMYRDDSDVSSATDVSCADGGASGQSYEEISLTEGDSIQVTIGSKGSNTSGTSSTNSGSNGGTTSFGEYSVNGGGGAIARRSGTRYTVGTSYGNLATTGSGYQGAPADRFVTNRTTGGGVLSSLGYGRGGTLSPNRTQNYQITPTAGAVYLKYLGA